MSQMMMQWQSQTLIASVLLWVLLGLRNRSEGPQPKQGLGKMGKMEKWVENRESGREMGGKWGGGEETGGGGMEEDGEL